MLTFRWFGRVAPLAVGLGMWGSVVVIDPGPGNLVMAGGGLMLFLWLVRRPARRSQCDARVLALVHDRIARSEELSVEAVRELTAELAGIRQRLDNLT